MTFFSKKLLFVLLPLLLIPSISADDGNECTVNKFNPSECYLGKIHQQNQILIQEQNLTNHLLAKLYCSQSNEYIEHGMKNCINMTLSNPDVLP